MSDLKERLVKPRLKEDTCPVPGVGDVRVRGLSRWEVKYDVQKAKDAPAMDRRVLVLGMVDPEMSDDDVVAWMKATDPGEIEDVLGKIMSLSGMVDPDADAEEASKAAAREAMLSFRDEP